MKSRMLFCGWLFWAICNNVSAATTLFGIALNEPLLLPTCTDGELSTGMYYSLCTTALAEPNGSIFENYQLHFPSDSLSFLRQGSYVLTKDGKVLLVFLYTSGEFDRADIVNFVKQSFDIGEPSRTLETKNIWIAIWKLQAGSIDVRLRVDEDKGQVQFLSYEMPMDIE